LNLKTIVTHEEVTTLHNTKGNEQDLDQYLEVTFERKETIAVQEEVSTLGHTSRSEQYLHQCLEITRKLKEKIAAHEEAPRGVHCDNIRKQRAGKYRVIYIHKRKNLEFS
jgi:mRNA-degrading endonuclease RelE of RelBE toxin-antitoxin system